MLDTILMIVILLIVRARPIGMHSERIIIIINLRY